LDPPDRDRALAKLSDRETGLGLAGENCASQDDRITFAEANVLLAWSSLTSQEFLERSKNLAVGLAENCRDVQDPGKYNRTRETAVNVLTRMSRSLAQDQRSSLTTRLS